MLLRCERARLSALDRLLVDRQAVVPEGNAASTLGHDDQLVLVGPYVVIAQLDLPGRNA